MKDGSTGNVHKISFDSIFMPVHDNNVVAVHPDLKAVRLTSDAVGFSDTVVHNKASRFESGMINHIITEYEFGDVFATAEGIWDESSAMKFHAAFRAHFEDATIEFNGAQSPSLTVYKKDGTVETPELKAEYEGESDVAGINVSNLGPYYTEIKYFQECVREDKPVEVAPLIEGVRSVQLGIKEWNAAKEYVNTHENK